MKNNNNPPPSKSNKLLWPFIFSTLCKLACYGVKTFAQNLLSDKLFSLESKSENCCLFLIPTNIFNIPYTITIIFVLSWKNFVSSFWETVCLFSHQNLSANDHLFWLEFDLFSPHFMVDWTTRFKCKCKCKNGGQWRCHPYSELPEKKVLLFN